MALAGKVGCLAISPQGLNKISHDGKSKKQRAALHAAFLNEYLWDEIGIKNTSQYGVSDADIEEYVKINADNKLTVGFTTNTLDNHKEWVKYILGETIQPLLSLQIVYADKEDIRPMIIIEVNLFDGRKAYSAVGTQSLVNASRGEHSLYLGWLDQNYKNSSYDVGSGAVIVHEFGHAIGLIHEHQSPKTTIQWNEAAVIAYGREEQHWDAETSIHNIIEQSKLNEVNATEYDPKSIMHYSLPNKLFANGINPTPNPNSYLSPMDEEWIRKHYGGTGIVSKLLTNKGFRIGGYELPRWFVIVSGFLILILFILMIVK